MQFTCLQVFSFVVLLAGTGLIIASIATSNWTESVFRSTTGVQFSVERGLWMQCTELKTDSSFSLAESKFVVGAKECKNRFQGLNLDNLQDNKDIAKGLQIWEIACISLMGGSALLGLLTLIFSPCCCNRCPCCLVFWSLLATMCCAAGIGTYAYEVKAEPAIDMSDLHSDQLYYGWSFWLAVAGGSCQLLATLLFGISRARTTYEYSHTI